MKKLILLIVALGFLTSCGPRRLGCGPGRCDIETKKNNTAFKNLC